ncbi:MAG: hypothetical protein HFG88_14730 [Dorea sp.]|nr:hypothetical protein [Dorea sp.]
MFLVAVIAIWSVMLNNSFTIAANAVFSFLTNDFGWLYLICMLVFLVFDVYVAFGRFGKIRLGGNDSRPEYKNLTWFYSRKGQHSIRRQVKSITFLNCEVGLTVYFAFLMLSGLQTVRPDRYILLPLGFSQSFLPPAWRQPFRCWAG